MFLWCRGEACYYFPTKLKPRFSTKDTRVDQYIRTTEAPCSGWSKWPCIVHGQSALCLFSAGSVAEPKVNSWSEATLRQLFQVWLSVMWTSNFSCFVHNHGLCFLQVWCPTVFASLGHRVLWTFGLKDTLSKKDPTKMCNTASSSSNQRMMVEVVLICKIAATLTINQWIMMLMTFSCYDNNTAAYLHHHQHTAVFTRFIFSFL